MAYHQHGLSVLAVSLAICYSLISAAAAAPLSSAAAKYVEAHNKARAAVGVPPLKWSESLSNATSRLVRYQRDRMGCNFANLTSGKYGGNQLWSSGQVATPTMVMDTWVKEKEFYNHADNTCVAGHHCGVYTLVVWRKSVEVGCAQAACRKDQSSLSMSLQSSWEFCRGESVLGELMKFNVSKLFKNKSVKGDIRVLRSLSESLVWLLFWLEHLQWGKKEHELCYF